MLSLLLLIQFIGKDNYTKQRQNSQRKKEKKGLTYIGKSTRHVITRAKEHLNLGSSVKSKIKDHIIECNLCNKKDMDSLIHRFSVIKKCSSDYDCKIHEALIIKKHQPKLNKQLYENGSSFLLQLF